MQKKKAQLKTSETTLWIKNNNQRNKWNQDRENQHFTYRVLQRRFLNFNHDRNINNEFKVGRLRRECFLYDNDYKIKNCNLLRKLRKLVKRNWKKIKTSKNKKNKQKTYNVEIFLMNDDSFIDVNFDNEKNMKKIIVLFKELINKIFKSNWIVNIDVLFYMIDQLQFFNKTFISIKRRTIKIEEKILHLN